MKKALFTAFLAAIFLVLGVNSAQAQAPSPIKWSAKIEMTSKNAGVVILTAVIDEGWHIYGTTMPEDGPNPTQFSFESKGVKFTDKVRYTQKPHKEMDAMFGCEVTYWEKQVTFKRKFKVTDPKDASITVNVSYMGCNDSNCIPPKKESFTLKPVE